LNIADVDFDFTAIPVFPDLIDWLSFDLCSHDEAAMSTDQAREIEALRAQVREHQEQAATPSVGAEGFKCLEELSQAIERNDLAGFI
jgi:hypothetical protein